jgi:glycerol-3-phosphate dehydrogenase
LLVGTTDQRYDGDPADVRPEPAELHYLLDEARALFPAAGLDETMVRYAYSGLRPLLDSRGGPESAITRRHGVIDHARSGGPAGLYSVAGGKLSTYRPLARKVLRHIGRRSDDLLPAVIRARATARTAKTGLEFSPHLARYGAGADSILDMGAEMLCEHAGAVTGEVTHAVKCEMATTVSDVLMRRTGIAWHSCRGLCCHRQTATLLGNLLGWDQAIVAGQVAAYERDVTRHLPAWTDVMADDDGK